MTCTELRLVNLIPLMQLVDVLLSSNDRMVAGQVRIPIGTIFPPNPTALHVRSAFSNGLGEASLFRFERFDELINQSNGFEVSKTICSAISKRPFALFGLLDASTLVTVTDFMNALNMPYITISNPTGYNSSKLPRHQNNDFILYMRPAYDKALIDVIVNYKWPKIFYIFDSHEGLLRLEKLFVAVDRLNSSLEIESAKLSNVSDSYETLRQIDSSEPDGTNKRIVLDLSTEEGLLSILKQIQLVGMNRKGLHYLLGGIAFDEIDVSDFRHSGVNITGFRLINESSTELRMAQEKWLQLDPYEWPGAGNGSKLKLEAALAMDSVSVLTKALTSLLDENKDELSYISPQDFPETPRRLSNESYWKKGGIIMKYIKQVHFTGISGIIAFDDQGYRKDFSLGIYELNLNSNPKHIASWKYNEGLTKVEHTGTISLPVRKPKPENRTIIVTSILSHPFLSIKRNNPSQRLGTKSFEGYCADMTKILAEILDLNYELRLVEDGRYGMINSNGTWNGMIGELTARKADIAVAPITITSMRERVVEFSKPYMTIGISIMIKKPSRQSRSSFYFLERFDTNIWMCIVASYLAVSFVLFLVGCFSSYSWQLKEVKDCSIDGLTSMVGVPNFKNEFTVLNSFWFALGAFMRQGCCLSPRSLPGRVVSNIWWVFSVIVIALYTASLTAVMIKENQWIPGSRLFSPIGSADDLVKQSEILYGTLDAGSTKEFFRNSRIPVYEQMWEFMSEHPDVFTKTVEEGITRVRNSQGKYAFLLESSMNDFHNHRKPCNTLKIGDNLDSKGYGVAMPIGSPLREKIDHAILMLIERGFFAKLYKKWWFDKGECSSVHQEDNPPLGTVTLRDMSNLFFIFLAGLCLSIVAFSLELFYVQMKMKTTSRARLHSESVQDHSISLDVATQKEAMPVGAVTASDPIPSETTKETEPLPLASNT